MASRFRVDGNTGKCAIWEGATDTAPFDNPTDNLSRVKFHSDLNYINVIQERVATLSLPALTSAQVSHASQPHVASHTLFAHGRPGIPFILGKVAVGGQPAAFVGSIPIQMGSLGSQSYYGRWITLGADATNVYVYEYVLGQKLSLETYAALSVPVTVWITNELLD